MFISIKINNCLHFSGIYQFYGVNLNASCVLSTFQTWFLACTYRAQNLLLLYITFEFQFFFFFPKTVHFQFHFDKQSFTLSNFSVTNLTLTKQVKVKQLKNSMAKIVLSVVGLALIVNLGQSVQDESLNRLMQGGMTLSLLQLSRFVVYILQTVSASTDLSRLFFCFFCACVFCCLVIVVV